MLNKRAVKLVQGGIFYQVKSVREVVCCALAVVHFLLRGVLDVASVPPVGISSTK